MYPIFKKPDLGSCLYVQFVSFNEKSHSRMCFALMLLSHFKFSSSGIQNHLVICILMAKIAFQDTKSFYYLILIAEIVFRDT